ncbi:MAG: hypothetical protein RBT38_05795 [Bacteroidales bacterium]|jgi:hypothetical protein|nr:hypothetical protein [Bacteroidales bacterium]
MITVRRNIYCLFLQLTLLLLITLSASAQKSSQNKKIFAEAESCYLFDEHELANPLYLLLDQTDNYNIQYKIGTCYLNIQGEKDKSIPFLESAVKNSAYDAKVNKFPEKRAPLDSWFFLAKAYMINNELEKALSTFEHFKQLAMETEEKGGMKNLTYVDQQIEACRNAMKNEKNPFRISKRQMGKEFSQGSINENPAVSFDGNTIVYTERRGILNAIMFSKKTGDKWQTPVEITSELQAGDDCSSCALNYDGTYLLLYKTDNFDGNIYSSEYVNGKWTPIKKLNRNINTKFYESHAAISADGKKLYFTSNREGGKGGLDIYLSVKDATGDWGTPFNLGNNINTIYNEDTPFITLNDSILYFSSEGHSGMGGYDIYRSHGNGTVWNTPENLGFPLNTTDDDRFFQPFNNDENGYYSIATQYKKKDIFYITLTNPGLNKIYELTGNYSLKDTVVQFDESNAIYLIDKLSGIILETGYPDMFTGNYSFIIGPGNYSLLYTGPEGYYPQNIDLIVPPDTPAGVIRIRDVVLEKETPDEDEKIDLTDIPVVKSIDPGILVKDLKISDVSDTDAQDTTILYYTVQVMALYNPVDISYFRYVSDIRVFYSETDYFYRYTTGIFKDKNLAYAHRDGLIGKGYPDDLFVKKVTRTTDDTPVASRKYFTIQLKATKTPLDISSTFRGLQGVRETKEIDGMYHYLYGSYASSGEAKTALQNPAVMIFEDAFVREIDVLMQK